MMNRIADFMLISEEQFRKDLDSLGLCASYEDISLPKRATSGSAGYDFYLPMDIILEPGEEMTVPTGIRTRIDEGWFLMCAPRSGLAFRFRLQLNNTVGIIDSDYFHAENEGHIMARMINDSRTGKTVELKKGSAFMQGIFIPFGITNDDNVSQIRTGGFGSTSDKGENK